MKVLLTGSHGFVGEYTEKLLASKHEISVLDRNAVTSLNQIDCVIHLGGLVKGSPHDLIEANTLHTLTLLEACIEQKRAIHFIYASSFAVYKDSLTRLSEDSLKEPRNFYGLSKLWAEQAIYQIVKNTEMYVTVLRFSNIYGPGMLPYSHSVVATFIDQVKSGKEITLNGDGTQARDFVYIDDAVSAIQKAAESKKAQVEGTFNICSQHKITLNELISAIANVCDITPAIKYNKDVNDTGGWVGDNNLAKKRLHWSPAISFEEGIKKCV